MKATDVGLWAAVSLVVGVLVPALAWMCLYGRIAGPKWRARLRDWESAGQPITWLVRSLFFLLPPLLAWRLGILSLYYVGVTETDWLALAGAAGTLALSIIALALFGWLVYRRSLRSDLGDAWQPTTTASLAGNPGPWLAPLDDILVQWHWAFYRAVAIGWLAAGNPLPRVGVMGPFAATITALYAAGQAQPLYWGSWLGLGLAGIEWGLNPFVWSELRSVGRQEKALRAVGLAIATTALFSFTRNFWLCLVCTVTVEALIAGWLPLPSAG